ncbi:MAG: hypothetical protein KGI50_03295 [Patescibacteria group bacterium]|nr:hypothetical protein [Patescibacteria group bacterium]MDE2438316.1 hypothetical protein [Patescibacteria group bacterium]
MNDENFTLLAQKARMVAETSATISALIEGLIQEVTRRDFNASDPPVYKHYLFEALGIMHFRLAQGDLKALDEFLAAYDPLKPFLQRFYNSADNYLRDVARECDTVMEVVENARVSLSILVILKKFQACPEEYGSARALLNVLSDKEYMDLDSICACLTNLKRNEVLEELGKMYVELLVHAETRYGTTPSCPKPIIRYFYSLTDAGKRVREALFKEKVL